MDLENSEESEKSREQALFLKKRKQLHSMKQKTQNMLISNPDQGYERRDDLQYVIYESKEKMVTHDCCRYDPEIKDISNLKDLFVTGMENDVLNEMESESDEQKEKERKITKILNKNTKKA